jgi:hypothetical protein
MNERCPLCERPRQRRHHVTGRGADGRYLDRKAVIGLCHDHHELIGDDWRTAGADDEKADETFLGSLELRLDRAAMLAGRVAQEAPPPFSWVFQVIATLLASWAASLAGSLTVLDRYSPGWRAQPGV